MSSSAPSSEMEERKTYTLLLWHEMPKGHRLYLIPNEQADRIRYVLEGAQGCYYNTASEGYGVHALQWMLDPDGLDVKTDLRGYLVPEGSVVKGVYITHVYSSGIKLFA